MRVPLPILKDDYYRAMHWDPKTGHLSKARAAELEKNISDLKKIGAASAPAAPATPAQALQRDAEPNGRNNQRIERVRIEDAGSRVDELRVGGETQNITVQPKTNAPEYQVQRDGSRVWNVFRF